MYYPGSENKAIWVSDQVRHKPACTVTEGGYRLEILDFERRGFVLSDPCSENKGADQLRSYCEADLRLLFSPMQIVGFPMRRFIFTLGILSWQPNCPISICPTGSVLYIYLRYFFSSFFTRK